MNTYKVKIKTFGSKTHLMGYLVVMAKSEIDALAECAVELNTPISDFESPQLFSRGIVYCTSASSWDGYH